MSAPREVDVRAGGLAIRVHDHGGDGPDLVLVHATGFHGRIWDPFVPRLRERFRVVALDQRGHGDSDKPEGGYEWARFGEDVLAVVDGIALDRPRAMGHSAGGAALVLAETSRPGTFDRLVLMDPVTPFPDVRVWMRDGQANPMVEGARRRRRIWGSHEEMIGRIRAGTPLSGWREEFLRAYVEHGTAARPDGTFELKCPPEVEAQIYQMGGRHDGWERLSSITCPTLLLVGERSEMWWAERRDEAAAQLRNGRAETVAGGGHFFPMEDPDATLAHVLPFLEEGA